MKITDKQLRAIINEEIKKMVDEAEEAAPVAEPTKPMSAGAKYAAKAGEATSLSAYETQAGKVMDAPGLAELIKQTIQATPLKGKISTVQTALKLALKDMSMKKPV